MDWVFAFAVVAADDAPTATAATEWFSWPSLASLPAATTAVVVVSGFVHRMINKTYARGTTFWVPALVALAIVVVTQVVDREVSAKTFLLAFLNTALLYGAAMGTNELIARNVKHPEPPAKKGDAPGAEKEITMSWFRT